MNNKDIIVFDSVGGGLGDEICTEPSVRYACKYLYPNEDVRICTKYPEVFKHLNKLCGKNKEELKIGDSDKFLRFTASPYCLINGKHHTHPFANIAQPLFISTVDFHSMFMIKRILPDEDKRIFLQVNKNLKDLIKENPKNLIAIHPYSSNNTKNFSKEYTQSLIDCLTFKGFKTVVFGKTDNKEDFKNTINLINLLDIERTFALISKTWLLITTDSAPLHIASVFDNYIILVPTIKHPDRLIHPRHGQRYWKAAALYKKLIVDDKAWPPHKDISGPEWYPSITDEEKQNYFPNIEDIVNKVVNWSIERGNL